MQKFLLSLLLSVFVSFTFSQKAKDKKKPGDSLSSSTTKYGVASFYAKKFDGRQTASGERFSSKNYTAACNVLPLNTWVQVTNIRNDKCVIVRINDRMHPKNKRLIDLSKVAAKDLGFTGHGLTRVKLEVLPNYHPDIASE